MRLLIVFGIALFCLVACKSEDKSKSNTNTSSSDSKNAQISEQDVKAPIVDQSMLFSDNTDYQTQTSDVTMATQGNQSPTNPTLNSNSEKNADLIPPKPTAEEIRLANIAKQAIMQYGNALQTGKTHQQAYEEFQQYIKQQNVTAEETEQLNDMMEIMGGYMGAEAGWKNRSDNNVAQSGKTESPEINNQPTTTGTNATSVNATESDVNPYSLQQMQSQPTSSNSNSIQEKSEAAQVKNPSSKNEAFDFNDLPVPVSVGGKTASIQPPTITTTTTPTPTTSPLPTTEKELSTQQPQQTQQPQTQQTQTPQQTGTETRLQTLINQYDTSKQPKEKGTNQSGNTANEGE